MDAEDDRDQPWNFHTCKFCMYRSKSTFLMCKHVRLHQNRSNEDTFICNSKTPETLECEICEFSTDLKVNLYEHVRVDHESKETNTKLGVVKCLRCRNCDLETHSLLVLTKHVFDQCNVSKNVKRFKCAHCTFQAESARSLKSHTLMKHSTFKCGKCPFQTRYRKTIRLHKYLMHSKPETMNWFQCDQCSFQTKFKDYLEIHKLRKHTGATTESGEARNIVWFECDQCPFKTKHKGNLKTHVLNKHSNPEEVNWFNCDQCPFKTKQKGILKTHVHNKHVSAADIKWFKCDQCPYEAKQKGLIDTHVLRMHLKSRCKTTKLEDSLQRHKLRKYTDTEQKDNPKTNISLENGKDMNWFNCDQCPFKTKLKCVLKTHIYNKHLSAADIKWFQCVQCPYQAKLKGHLDAHISRIHLKPRCKITKLKCHKLRKYTDTKQKDLKTDIFVENGKQEDMNWFNCDKCPFKTQRKGILKTHIYRDHHFVPEDVKSFKDDHYLYQAKQEDQEIHTPTKHLESKYKINSKLEDSLKFHKDERAEDVKSFKDDHYPYQAKQEGEEIHTPRKHLESKYKISKLEDSLKFHKDEKVGTSTESGEGRSIVWFECELCPFKAKQKGNLKTHIFIKHGNLEGMFQCEQCPFKTKQKGILKTHIYNKHLPPEDINWFKCKHCPYQAKHEGVLKSHILKRHCKI